MLNYRAKSCWVRDGFDDIYPKLLFTAILLVFHLYFFLKITSVSMLEKLEAVNVITIRNLPFL